MLRSIVFFILLLMALMAHRSAFAADQPAVLLLAPGKGDVRALVVGIDHYHNVNMLRGAVADAHDVETALRRMGSQDVTTLIDDQADRLSLLRELEALVARTKSGDLIIMTLAGHGSREEERVKGSSNDGTDEVFLLVGFDPKTGPGGAEKILNHEFHHYLKALEAKGAQVIFVADTCYGGGLAREIAIGSAEVSYRQVPRYRLVEDDLKPVSTPADALLTELDFKHTTFLAAVDSQTKAPEVMINGVYRGALSYAVARAIEGAADEHHDGKITMGELFAYSRKVVYQLSDGRQNIVTMESPTRDLNHDVVLQLGDRGVNVPGLTAASHVSPATLPSVTEAQPVKPQLRPIRLASLTRNDVLKKLRPLQTDFDIVDQDEAPDVIWNPVDRVAIAGSDVVAQDVGPDDLPGVIDRTAVVRDIKERIVKAPQAIRVLPNDSLHREGQRVEVQVDDAAGRHLILVDITGIGTVQMLYPTSRAQAPLTPSGYHIPFTVRDPFGADEVLAITSQDPMDALASGLRSLDNRRSAGSIIDMIDRFAPPDAKIGLAGLYTAH